MLQNLKYTNKCLYIKGKSLDNNADLQITTCDSSKEDQQLNIEDWTVSFRCNHHDAYLDFSFRLKDYANRPGQIRFLLSKKCLTVNGNGKSNGDRINQYDCLKNASNQLWKIRGSFES